MKKAIRSRASLTLRALPQLARNCGRENVYPVEINQAQTKKETAVSAALKINLWERVSAGEVAVFTRQLSTLLGAGMPLVPSLSILMQQEKILFEKLLREHPRTGQ